VVTHPQSPALCTWLCGTVSYDECKYPADFPNASGVSVVLVCVVGLRVGSKWGEEKPVNWTSLTEGCESVIEEETFQRGPFLEHLKVE